MVDQSALVEASRLWFQDQSDSLELNRRMKLLMEQKEKENGKTSSGATSNSTIAKDVDGYNGTAKISHDASALENSDHKRAKTTKDPSSRLPQAANNQAVQKFKYVSSSQSDQLQSKSTSDYRLLVATFCDVNEASGCDPTQRENIIAACEGGGNFVGSYYYQYEVLPATLTSQEARSIEYEMRTSMGLHSFLQDTKLPPFHPLSNLQSGSNHKVLSMLNMKRDSSGNVVWDQQNAIGVENDAALLAGGTRLQSVPMQPRVGRRYEIGVIGGGIAGLACCQELVTLLRSEGINARVTLMEARSRLGGRLWTDQSLSIGEHKKCVPLELGASWIHGIDHNPLAALCKRANIDFVTASEEVTMLDANGERVDSTMDKNMGQLFDDLLDHAAEDCWSSPAVVMESAGNGHDEQATIKWYSSVFAEKTREGEEVTCEENRMNGFLSGYTKLPQPSGVPLHRKSSDRSVDFEIGQAVAKHKLRDFSKLGDMEHRMLMWNTKNVEYALGANISDLSMKFWDSDERHAFEGEHVMLQQGYSAVIDHMLDSLQAAGKNSFDYVTDYPVGKVEYARKSATQPYGHDTFGSNKKLVELSDTCSVTKEDGTDTKYFDFLVCAVPLGVLKEAITHSSAEEKSDCRLSFQPPLPFSKIDAITNVGFGLLDKVFLQFETPFWRKDEVFEDADQCIFGNVTGKHSHHYMFFDVGKTLGNSENGSPPILMSLISGIEAVKCEHLSDDALVAEVMDTLGTIFSDAKLDFPVAHRITRWGKDRFSRGSYTFLPPGATDQDFNLLQSPVNGNGDSLWIEGNETMRLFFAGEHTTALHPSMAHGAMLSGMRAAEEVLSTLQFKSSSEKDMDRILPEPLFRHKNPTTPLQCSLCHKHGGQVREGRLVSFKRGARQVLVHNNCAENCPEVEVVDSKWKHVIKAVNRGKALTCTMCKMNGATIGCTSDNCFRIFHFSCAEDTGWRFDRDSKVFYCDLHRSGLSEARDQNDRISISFFLSKNPASSLICSFCRATTGKDDDLIAYQSGFRQMCVHERCIKYTTIVDTSEVEHSRMGKEYRNVFRALEVSQACRHCGDHGATVVCADPACGLAYHVCCAESSGWNFQKRGKSFFCTAHRDQASRAKRENEMPKDKMDPDSKGLVSHNLLAQFGAKLGGDHVNIASNLDIGGTKAPLVDSRDGGSEEGSLSSEDTMEESDHLAMKAALSPDVAGEKLSVQVDRASTSEPWDLSLCIDSRDMLNYLVVAVSSDKGKPHGLQPGDVIVSINGTNVGSEGLYSLHEVLHHLQREVSLIVEVIRNNKH
eukprot:scaffold11924_cov118-Cylindrotheca_fusiformis.AAC.6